MKTRVRAGGRRRRAGRARPGFWGRLRLPRPVPARPAPLPVAADAPVVVMIPVHDEEGAVGDVVSRDPRTVHGRPVRVLVVDDGSTDGSAREAADAGATVLPQPRNLGLGAAVRRGLAEASALAPAAVVYLDADGEYFPEDIPSVVAPVLDGIGRLRRRLAVHRRHPADAAAPPARQPGADRVGALDCPPARPHRRPERLPGLLPRGCRRRPRSCTTTTTRRC